MASVDPKRTMQCDCAPTFVRDRECHPCAEPTEPGPTEPGPTEPGTTEPGVAGPGPTEPGTADPGPSEPPPKTMVYMCPHHGVPLKGHKCTGPVEREGANHAPRRSRAAKGSQYITSWAHDGKLDAGCKHCHVITPVSDFAPKLDSGVDGGVGGMDRNKNKRKAFDSALARYFVAVEAGDEEGAAEARAIVEANRNAWCNECVSKTGRLTHDEAGSVQNVCKTFYLETRRKACESNGGCENAGCVMRCVPGTVLFDAVCAFLEADHVHDVRHPDPALRKERILSDHSYWSRSDRGVAAMEREIAKGIRWVCAFCHRLKPSRTGLPPYPDPSTLPDGKQSGTKEERTQYNRKWEAKITHPKSCFVNDIKRARGCENCGRRCVEGEEPGFDFDHNEEGKTSSIAVLVARASAATRLDNPAFKARLDAEIEKCRVLCRNCHVLWSTPRLRSLFHALTGWFTTG